MLYNELRPILYATFPLFTTLENFAVDKTSLRNRISIKSSAIAECYYRVLSDIAMQFFIAEAGRCLASYSLYMWVYTEFGCHM
jgi:hypothetical protein